MVKCSKMCVGVALLFALTGLAKGAIITLYSFDSATVPAAGTTAGPLAADTGSGSFSAVHASSSTYSTPAGNGTTKSFSSNTWAIGDYYQFTSALTPTPGLEVEFAQVSSTTGPLTFQLEYSTDGTTYNIPTSLPNAGLYTVSGSVSFSSGTTKTTSPPLYLFDFTGVSDVESASNLSFRLIDTTAPSGSSGTDRVDTITIGTNLPAPTPVPEPAMLGMGAMAAIGMLSRRRRA